MDDWLMISMKLRQEHLDKLARMGKETKLNRSAVMRQLIEQSTLKMRPVVVVEPLEMRP